MDELNDQFKKSADDFSLTPSPGTWSNVQADISARKRKRKFIIFFFLLAGIILGGLFLLNKPSRKAEILPREISLTPTESQKPKAIQQDISSEKSIVPQEHFSAQQNNSIPGKNTKKKNTSITKTNSQDKKQHRNAKTSSPRTIQPEKVESPPTSESENMQPPAMLSEEDNVISGNMESSQACETTSFPTPLSESLSSVDSIIKTDSKDSLQTSTGKDSVLAVKAETISKSDSTSALKDSLKSYPCQGKWSIGIGVAPTKSYTKLSEGGDYQFISHYRDSSDKILLTWNYHLNLTFNLLPEIGLFTGIGIEHFSQEILNDQAVYKYDTIQSLTVGPSSPAITVEKSFFHIHGESTGTVKNKFTYLEIPFGIHYVFLHERKFNISLLPEIAFNKLIHSEGYRYHSQNLTYEKIADGDLKSWLMSYGVGLSFQYAIKKNIGIELIPYYKSLQKSIWNSSDPISQRFQQTELRFSLRYLLK